MGYYHSNLLSNLLRGTNSSKKIVKSSFAIKDYPDVVISINLLGLFTYSPFTAVIVCVSGVYPSYSLCLHYDTKMHLMIKLQFWNSGMCVITPSLPLLPGPP